MKTALIFNIQKFCVHDGPGIRTTVFFKGCPLKCQWCHNPESQNFSKQVLWTRERCTFCQRCEQACPQGAISVTQSSVLHHASRCLACEQCIDDCVNNAREIAGVEYTVSQLLSEIEKDRPFYDQSQGGVTLSGGEVMSQIEFAAELAQACKNRGITVAIDTCGYAPFSSFEKIMDSVDLFLYDIKLIDSSLHQRYTGADNKLILGNLKKLAQHKARINLRLPLIEGFNADDRNIRDIIDFVQDFQLVAVNLLPYHEFGKTKYNKMDENYQGEKLFPPSETRLNEIKTMFEQAEFNVRIGG
ncbi:trans-4-hydroxy-L-proline dehydratase activase [Sporomusa malonica]|uniref:Pyruvate formate lyase activating enzyme n=1 Tax=Sporomusa malonica TaxID=112901 RepID=A0A1W2DYW8_9FIRM|nr:trans-4-hydroxy-L-proline dehydratase activase [Sporomusa malonica]SMD02721.1 pyruvate formate lyase activating enzyme [Sporomusa malonica]